VAIQIEIVLSVVGIVLLVVVWLVDPRRDSAGPTWMWRLGDRDPFSRALFGARGQMRAHTKWLISIMFMAWLSVLWLLVP